MKKVLVCETEQEARQDLCAALEKNHYEIITAQNGREVIEAEENYSPDAVIMNIELKEVDGLTAMKAIRRYSKVPIIIISHRDKFYEIIVGLNSGADDYVTKPFSAAEVVARLEAIFRRIEMEHRIDVSLSYKELLVVGNLKISMNTYTVMIGNEPVKLSRKEVDTLYLFASNPNKVFTRDNLLDSLWGYDFYGDNRSVDTHIKRLRKKLSAYDNQGWRIATVWGKGYKMDTIVLA